MILCRWRMLPSRCVTLSFSRALHSLFNRVINFLNQFFLSIICHVVLHDCTGGQTAAHREMHFPNFQLPVSESTHWHCCVGFRPNGLYFLLLSLQRCRYCVQKGGWRMTGDLLLKWEQGQIKIYFWNFRKLQIRKIFTFLWYGFT